MSRCPICSQSMTARRPNGHPRQFCSKSCSALGASVRIRTRNADMDEVVVIHLLDGTLITSTKAERLEAVRQLTSRGYSLFAIASRLHTTARSVSRYRAELHTRREIAA